MKRVAFTCALSLTCLLGTSVALADPGYSVSIKKTDFRNAKTVAGLHQRIRKQSREACPNYFAQRDLRAISNCRQEVEADLVSKINHPLLNAYVEGEESLRLALAERADGDDRS
ncbi:MAG: UrcA family protein [Pseudomonadales bacterium]